MKKWKVLLAISGVLIGISLYSAPSDATMFMSMDLADITTRCGTNSLIIDGKVTAATPIVLPNGWKAVVYTVVGTFVKPPDPSVWGKRIQKIDGQGVVNISMIGGTPGRSVIRGIYPPKLNDKGVFFFTAPSEKSGLCGFCGATRGQGFFEAKTGAGGKVMLVNGFKNANLKLNKLRTKGIQADSKRMAVMSKSLKNIQSAPADGLPKEEFLEVVRGLLAGEIQKEK